MQNSFRKDNVYVQWLVYNVHQSQLGCRTLTGPDPTLGRIVCKGRQRSILFYVQSIFIYSASYAMQI